MCKRIEHIGKIERIAADKQTDQDSQHRRGKERDVPYPPAFPILNHPILQKKAVFSWQQENRHQISITERFVFFFKTEGLFISKKTHWPPPISIDLGRQLENGPYSIVVDIAHFDCSIISEYAGAVKASESMENPCIFR
jgi:hypothetical protein